MYYKSIVFQYAVSVITLGEVGFSTYETSRTESATSRSPSG